MSNSIYTLDLPFIEDNEQTNYFAKADTEMTKALTCLDSLKSMAFVAAPDWPVRDDLVRALLAMVRDYPWFELCPLRSEKELYDFIKRNQWRLAILFAVPCYLAETAPIEAMDGSEFDEQGEFIGNLAKKVIDVAGNLSFVYSDLSAIYSMKREAVMKREADDDDFLSML